MTGRRSGIAAAMLAAGCGTAATASGRPALAACLLTAAAAAAASAWVWWHPDPPAPDRAAWMQRASRMRRVHLIAGDPDAFAALMVGAGAGDLGDPTAGDR